MSLSRWLERLAWHGRYLALPGAVRGVLDRVQRERLTYLGRRRLVTLARAMREVEAARRPGVVLELGCALGGSGILLAAAKRPERELRLYDVFGMIPPPGAEDGADVHARYAQIKDGGSQGLGGDTYYGYLPDLYERVRGAFTAFGFPPETSRVRLIRGLVQDTLELDQPVALAHVDVDWYDPVLCALERIWPRLNVGGRIVLDDYQDWSGCRKATDRFLAARPAGSHALDLSAGSLVLTKLVEAPPAA
jgi:asparagine synthase (glutamine-hydrolysing)